MFLGNQWFICFLWHVMMMMNCFCGMVDRRNLFSLISSWDHCQRSSRSWISDMPPAVLEPAQNLSSGFVQWSCAVVNKYITKINKYICLYVYIMYIIYTSISISARWGVQLQIIAYNFWKMSFGISVDFGFCVE